MYNCVAQESCPVGANSKRVIYKVELYEVPWDNIEEFTAQKVERGSRKQQKSRCQVRDVAAGEKL